MLITPIKTHKITQEDTDILSVLDKYISDVPEKSVVAVTSKIVSICEGRIVAIDPSNPEQKDQLIEEEAQVYLPRSANPYNVSLTVTHDILAVSAGIDESNGNGYYILWPEDPQESANRIREYLCKRFSRKYIGVIITDSKTTSMRWGVTAITIGFSGILPLKNYINMPDIFGRPFAFEQMSIIDNLACSAALVMGEGSEQTPLALVNDVPMVEFVDHNPTTEELADLKITLEEDVYGEFLKNAPWQKGKGGKGKA